MLAALVVLGVLGAWELYAQLSGVDALVLPAPHEVAQALWVDRALLWSNFTVTAREMLLGMACAVLAAAALSVLLHLSTTARRALYPLLIGTQVIPVILIAPLLVLWFGFDLTPKVVIVALVCFFPIVVTTLDGLGATGGEERRLMATLGASRWQRLRFVDGPGAVPSLFSGLRVAVAVAAIGAVFAEFAGTDKGLGHLLQQAIPQLETARAYAAVVVLVAFTLALFGALTLLERRLLPWAHPTPEGPA